MSNFIEGAKVFAGLKPKIPTETERRLLYVTETYKEIDRYCNLANYFKLKGKTVPPNVVVDGDWGTSVQIHKIRGLYGKQAPEGDNVAEISLISTKRRVLSHDEVQAMPIKADRAFPDNFPDEEIEVKEVRYTVVDKRSVGQPEYFDIKSRKIELDFDPEKEKSGQKIVHGGQADLSEINELWRQLKALNKKLEGQIREENFSEFLNKTLWVAGKGASQFGREMIRHPRRTLFLGLTAVALIGMLSDMKNQSLPLADAPSYLASQAATLPDKILKSLRENIFDKIKYKYVYGDKTYELPYDTENRDSIINKQRIENPAAFGLKSKTVTLDSQNSISVNTEGKPENQTFAGGKYYLATTSELEIWKSTDGGDALLLIVSKDIIEAVAPNPSSHLNLFISTGKVDSKAWDNTTVINLDGDIDAVRKSGVVIIRQNKEMKLTRDETSGVVTIGTDKFGQIKDDELIGMQLQFGSNDKSGSISSQFRQIASEDQVK